MKPSEPVEGATPTQSRIRAFIFCPRFDVLHLLHNKAAIGLQLSGLAVSARPRRSISLKKLMWVGAVLDCEETDSQPMGERL